ncbi:DUF6790 family protein [Pseudodesulfovibrio sp. zrk46]|uniref:DUF6790 family protein n=1 Tax=Pseudodesulfovibrio sp. zrk46 TaxID=2725288 RepID=UPI00144A1C96|nr:DUF6790 family protein [Pseudodesulfovibrio sp. zrk46]QJB55377.1 hypothetical protein HFN16_02755 [Pseudodesulfovibrio sp. zrk46]
MYTVYLACAALAVALMHILVLGGGVAESLLLWLLVIPVGLGGLWAFMGHYFAADKVAGYIGWPPGNPFQQEVAFANLALGISGLLCFFIRGDFWLATILFVTIFLVGAFSVHVRDIRASGNMNPGNAGPVFFADLLLPISLWALYLIS